MFGYRPKTETVTLPSSNITDIVTHDVEYALHSLLRYPDLMQDENLLINSKKPWEPLEDNGCFGDLHTGSLYRDVWKQYCTNERDVLCALIFFMDRTHTDVLNKLPVEAVTMTLSIFNHQTRSRPKEMRNIGYITNQDNIKYENTEEKMRDYHFILDFIFKGVKQFKSNFNGIRYEFVFDEPVKVYLKTPIMTFIGDNQGLDKLCMKYSNKLHANCLCRYCDCLTDHADQSTPNYSYIKQDDVRKLIEQKKKKS